MQIKKQQLEPDMEQWTGLKLGKEYIKAVYYHPAYFTFFLGGGSKITADGDCSHEIKRRLLLGRKVMTKLDSLFKSRDITLLTKVRPVKAMVFPIVMYGCESWDCEEG